jgi:hypothetical protein
MAKVVDPRVAIATPGGRRSLSALVERDREAAVAALRVLLEQGPLGGKGEEKFLLAWAGRVALGAHPLVAGDAREDAIAALDARFERIVAQLAHREHEVVVAATITIAACRAQAAEAQRALQAAAPTAGSVEIACSLRLASGVLARDTGCASAFAPYPVEMGQPLYRADVLRRALVGDATASELELALYFERALAKLPWFANGYEHVVRALIRARPIEEREAAALALVEEGKPDRAITLAFEHREVAERDVSGDALSVTQRRVLAAPIDGTRHASQIAILCDAYRVPRTDAERAKLLGDRGGARVPDRDR